jgi:arsenate reductase (thioredoxin)
MAEGFLKSFDKALVVISAGTRPEKEVNPYAVKVMNEIGIDISSQFPKSVIKFINETFDYVITVCDKAREVCPVFTGTVKQMFHLGFEDPADAIGSENEILSVYKRVRDEIKSEFQKFYEFNLH